MPETEGPNAVEVAQKLRQTIKVTRIPAPGTGRFR